MADVNWRPLRPQDGRPDPSTIYDTIIEVSDPRSGAIVGHAPLPKLLGAELSGVSRAGLVLGVRGTRCAERVPRLRSTADTLALIRGSLRGQGIDTLERISGRGSAGFQVTPPSGTALGRIIWSHPLAAEDQAVRFPDGWITAREAAAGNPVAV